MRTTCLRKAARLALGEDVALIPDLEDLARRYPVQEDIHGQLMVALYRAGRQADALRAYQRLRAILAEELGIEPSPALQAPPGVGERYVV